MDKIQEYYRDIKIKAEARMAGLSMSDALFDRSAALTSAGYDDLKQTTSKISNFDFQSRQSVMGSNSKNQTTRFR